MVYISMQCGMRPSPVSVQSKVRYYGGAAGRHWGVVVVGRGGGGVRGSSRGGDKRVLSASRPIPSFPFAATSIYV